MEGMENQVNTTKRLRWWMSRYALWFMLKPMGKFVLWINF